MPPDNSPGAIYDLGYQHYDGKRLGRAGAVRALYLQGLRSLFGLGRGPRAKIAPIALIIFMLVPAIIQTAVVGLVGNMVQLFTHAAYFQSTVWIFALFCAFQTPELVSSDQQYRVLALYFSRALLRHDYVLARLGALFTALFGVGLLPHIVLLLGTWFASPDLGAAIHTSLPMIPRIIAANLLIAISLTAVSLTIAAIIRRRPFATAAILAIFLLASAFVVPLVMTRPEKMRYIVLASPMLVAQGTSQAVFDTTGHIFRADAVRGAIVDTVPPPRAGLAPDSIVAARRRRRVAFRRRGVMEVANLPPIAYYATTLGLLLVAGGVLTLRYRSIET
ncbi:MAG TPA: hypothetical protein VGM77_09635 [Gemmatimonadales bacterium]|jgi:ABC-2 type transport system permease protein